MNQPPHVVNVIYNINVQQNVQQNLQQNLQQNVQVGSCSYHNCANEYDFPPCQQTSSAGNEENSIEENETEWKIVIAEPLLKTGFTKKKYHKDWG